MSYFQTRLASLPSFHFFHSSPKPVGLMGSLYLGRRCVVNGVLTRHWTDPPPPSQPSPPSIFCPHPLQHLFEMWLFLTPCAISLPDLPPISESVWLARQFHRISHAKRDPREGEPDSLPPCLQPLRGAYQTAVAEMFLWLRLHRCCLAARCTGGRTLMHGTYLWISHILLLSSFIKSGLSAWATPLPPDCLSISSSACPPHHTPHTHSFAYSLPHGYMRTCTHTYVV